MYVRLSTGNEDIFIIVDCLMLINVAFEVYMHWTQNILITVSHSKLHRSFSTWAIIQSLNHLHSPSSRFHQPYLLGSSDFNTYYNIIHYEG